MASDKKPASSRRTGGRVTPKGGPTRKNPDHNDHDYNDHSGPTASTRYTPRSTTSQVPSPLWLPYLMFGLFFLGTAVIFLHYVGLALPTAESNWWLLGGLGIILGGIITATQYR